MGKKGESQISILKSNLNISGSGRRAPPADAAYHDYENFSGQTFKKFQEAKTLSQRKNNFSERSHKLPRYGVLAPDVAKQSPK